MSLLTMVWIFLLGVGFLVAGIWLIHRARHPPKATRSSKAGRLCSRNSSTFELSKQRAYGAGYQKGELARKRLFKALTLPLVAFWNTVRRLKPLFLLLLWLAGMGLLFWYRAADPFGINWVYIYTGIN